MMKIVECVPNFSEGRDKQKIQAIAREIESVPGVKLLDVDPGETTNRTVVTFIGSPEAVAEAAFKGVAKAAEVIDMRLHKGAHSRIGATDVCPFVPVSGVTMEECVELANKVAARVASELSIPVYLYEEAARRPERKNLANIRTGEYEGLADKLKDPEWAPDYGEAVLNPKSGATVMGAREFLIAYNINLNTRDRKLAHEIALSLRESGRAKRDQDGNIEDYGLAQISINFTNYKVTPPHVVFDEAEVLARELGLRVIGSELVGLIPREALLMAGRHYMEKQGKNPGIPEEDLIRTAVVSLGLSSVAPFDPDKKIIEYQFRSGERSLVGLDLRRFANELSSDSPAPGGGSVSALCGALSASLASMVANLTYGRKEYREAWDEMKDIAVRAQALKDRLLEAVDEDTRAFNKVMDAFRMPKATPEQAAEKAAALEAANKGATSVPLGVMEAALESMKLANATFLRGNRNSASDSGVGVLTGYAAGMGAYYNVRINLPGIKDEAFRSMILKKAEGILAEMEKEREKGSETAGRVLGLG